MDDDLLKGWELQQKQHREAAVEAFLEEEIGDYEINKMLSEKILRLNSEIGDKYEEIEKWKDKHRLEVKDLPDDNGKRSLYLYFWNDVYVRDVLMPPIKELEKELARIRVAFEASNKKRGTKYAKGNWDEKKERAKRRTFEEIVEPFLDKPRKQGGRIVARCPLHDDSTASFNWYIEKGNFHCFGCGANGGDIIDFYRLLKKVDFKTAVEDLC